MRIVFVRGIWSLLSVTLLGMASLSAFGQKDAEGLAFFEQKVRPLLVAKCYSCHSAQSKPLQGGLLLDSKIGTLKGGDHGASLVPGQPEKSLLIQALHYTGKVKMPPQGKLSDAEIALLTEWVRRGAPDPREGKTTAPAKRTIDLTKEGKHWAYQPLKRVASPVLEGKREKGKGKSTPNTLHPIDAFILEKLQQNGLKPNPQADRRTLIRRAYFDLIGLPPTPDEVEAFVKDKSPGAWGKVIERLLASPHYGERWGRHWLDLARFAESHGYEQDYDRPNAYTYRDFVIKALNADMPYNQFVRWQLAGDEFASDDPMALMATGFLGAGTHATQITKSQVEKERYDELDDMTATTGVTFLGMTFGCARCHDHKFDPIPQRDYYRLVSTFTKTVRSDYDVNLDPTGYKSEKETFEKEHAPLVASLQKFETEQLPQRFETWRNNPNRSEPVWHILDVTEAKSAGGATLTRQDDGSFLAEGKNPDVETYTFTAKTSGERLTAIRLEALAHPSMVKGGPGRAGNGNFALTNVIVTAAPLSGQGQPVNVKFNVTRATFEQKGLPIAAAIDGDAKSAWAVDPQFGKDQAAIFAAEQPFGFPGGTALTITLKFENNTGHNIGRPRLSVTGENGTTVAFDAPARPERVARLIASLSGSLEKLPDADRKAVLGWYRTQDSEWQNLSRTLQEHQAKEPKPKLQKAMICSEGVPAIRTHTQGGDYLEQTHFLRRGDPNNKAEVVTQGFLTVLMRTPEKEKRWQETPPKDWRTLYQRRSLANWMTDVDNGAGALLARVIVNRLWQHEMGRGIVATPSDFGTQGERPTHPELLDYLATELIRNGWKLKAIHRLLLTSATYQQSAAMTPANQKRDPDNKLCWRHPRRRLEAEVIRDAILSVSGQLDATMFGPGTLDESMKRRSIYFFIKRSRLIQTMMLFDAPDSLQSIGARQATIIAPQALLLLNNRNVREYAAALSRRVAPKLDTPLEVALVSAYQVTLGRRPATDELTAALAFVREQERSYSQVGQTEPRSMALADFCQALFGLNEFVYID